MHRVPAAAHETVERRPIDLAKLCERDPCDLRFVFASPGREHHAPVGRRKQIGLTMPISFAGIHLPVFIKTAEESKRGENVRFRAARAPESLCKGKVIIMHGH